MLRFGPSDIKEMLFEVTPQERQACISIREGAAPFLCHAYLTSLMHALVGTKPPST